MNDEIKKILDRLERIDHKEYSGGFEFADSSSFDETARCFEERKKMANYITNLQQKVEQYENPEDLTLFYMWIDEKAKDKMKELQQENQILKEHLEAYKKDGDETQDRIDKAIIKLEESQKGLEEWHFDGYDPDLLGIINILKGDNND